MKILPLRKIQRPIYGVDGIGKRHGGRDVIDGEVTALSLIQSMGITSMPILQNAILSGNDLVQNGAFLTSERVWQVHITTADPTVIQANQPSVGSIVQNFQVTASTLTQANDITAGDVTQSGTILAANLTQTNEITTDVVTQDHLLSGNNLVQTTTSGPSSITQNRITTGATPIQTTTITPQAVIQNAIVLASNPTSQIDIPGGNILIPIESSLTGVFTVGVTGDFDLTTLGAVDWIDIGNPNGASRNEKTGGSLIGAVTTVGTIGNTFYAPTTTTWSDGTPIASVSASNLSGKLIANANEFNIPITAEAGALRKVVILHGAYNANSRVDVSFANGSATPLSYTPAQPTLNTDTVYKTEVTFRSSAATTLNIKVTLTTGFDGSPEIGLIAAYVYNDTIILTGSNITQATTLPTYAIGTITSLSATLAVDTTADYSLSDKGRIDWVDFGDPLGDSRNEKVGGGLIGPFIVTGDTFTETTFPVTTNWYDGTPLLSTGPSNKCAKIDVVGAYAETRIYCPANTPIVSVVLFGVYNSQARVNVSFEDASVTPYEWVTDAPANNTDVIYKLKMQHKAGATYTFMTVRVTFEADTVGFNAEVGIIAAYSHDPVIAGVLSAANPVQYNEITTGAVSAVGGNFSFDGGWTGNVATFGPRAQASSTSGDYWTQGQCMHDPAHDADDWSYTDRLTFMSDAGGQFVRVEVRPGDDPIGSSGERAEMKLMYSASVGGIVHETLNSGIQTFRFSTRFAANWENPDWDSGGGVWAAFFQFHGMEGNPGGRLVPPMIAMNAGIYNANPVLGERINISVRSGTTTGSTELNLIPTVSGLNKGNWIDWILTIDFTPHPTGRIKLQRKDLLTGSVWQTVIDQSNIATMVYDSVWGIDSPNYTSELKIGLYRSESNHTNILDLSPVTREPGTF